MQADTNPRKKNLFVWFAIAFSSLALLVGFLIKLWQRRKTLQSTRQTISRGFTPFVPVRIQGLSEGDVKARRQEGQDNVIAFKPRRTQQEIIRESIINIFNLDLIGLIIAQFVLGRAWDALISFGVMCLNIGLNIVQQLLARKRLSELEQTTRPKATVIRDGAVKNIDPSEIVIGDALVVGPGDQFLVDGELIGDEKVIVDESMLAAEFGKEEKSVGDPVFAGSFCASGHAAYRAIRVGKDRFVTQISDRIRVTKEDLTPLQSIINRVLQALLVLVIAANTILLINFFRSDIIQLEQYYIEAASLVFSLAPSGLFFMILVGYTVGTADLAKLGALVHQSSSVESLANVDVLCLGNTHALTGMQLDMDVIEHSGTHSIYSDSKINQILGDYARSISSHEQIIQMLAESYIGDRRPVIDEAPFLTVYGWNAVSFDENDLRGVFILGLPEILEPHLQEMDDIQPLEDGKEAQTSTGIKKFIQNMTGVFSRNGGKTNSEEDQFNQEAPASPDVEVVNEEQVENPEQTSDQLEKEPFFKRWFGKVKKTFQSEESTPGDNSEIENSQEKQIDLLFAFKPEIESIHDDNGSPLLPDDLIPLCHLRIFERVQEGVKAVINEFSQAGVLVKVLSSMDTKRLQGFANEAGFINNNAGSVKGLSGVELDGMSSGEFQKTIKENVVFGDLSPEQEREIVKSLRSQGHHVAMVGDVIADFPALQNANLAIATKGASQAVLGIADIVLLRDSLHGLLGVLGKGQKIVNGLLDVLKLYLTQILYLTLLMVMIRIVAFGIPYRPAQGSVINLLTLTIPAIFIQLWASSGSIQKSSLSQQLAHFIIPAGVSISLTGLLVFLLFLLNTRNFLYTQLTVTYTLLFIGLLLVLFVQPPSRAWMGGESQYGDRRLVWVVIVSFLLFFVMLLIPLARESFKIDWLQSPKDYLIIGSIVILWAFGVRLVWKIREMFLVRKEMHAAVQRSDKNLTLGT